MVVIVIPASAVTAAFILNGSVPGINELPGFNRFHARKGFQKIHHLLPTLLVSPILTLF